MFARLLALLLLLTLDPLKSFAAQPDHRMSNSVVQIQGAEAGGRLYFGSGVIVAPRIVATNCHVVRTGGRLGIFRGYRSYRVEGVRADVKSDLCLLDVPALDLHPARLAGIASLKKGDTLFFYGFPRALGLSFTDGKVLRTRRHEGLPLIETSAFFTLGGSGGGLFDRRGRLVGLATYIDRGHGGGYYAIGSDLIADVMKRPSLPIGPLSGLAFWETSPASGQGAGKRD
ncbi:MAG: hypothetical protein RLZ25_2346 [Pseudomonadota bacterium]|jgi:S1-C subfamily serine protease